MKILILGLSATLGTLSGLFYDIHAPILNFVPITLSGPAMAMSFAVFFILASLMLGFQMIMSQIQTLPATHKRSILPESDLGPKLDFMPMPTTAIASATSGHEKQIRLPVIDLQNLELRAERLM